LTRNPYTGAPQFDAGLGRFPLAAPAASGAGAPRNAGLCERVAVRWSSVPAAAGMAVGNPTRRVRRLNGRPPTNATRLRVARHALPGLRRGPEVTMNILWTLIIGLIIGALAKLIMPGRDPGGIIIT